MVFVYHYHAQVQLTASQITHLCGLLHWNAPIDNMTQYHEAKKLIAGANDQNFPVDRLIICSLSFLHTTE